jgi:hypothetical protein
MTIRPRAPRRNLVLALLATALCGLAALAVPALAAAETFTVSSTGDQAQQTPGSAICKSTANTCTLRAAIEAADVGSGGDEILFAGTFNGELADTINLGSALPTITAQGTVIHGVPLEAGTGNHLPCATAAGKSGPCVGVNGPTGGATFRVDASGVKIEELAISGSSTGIRATAGSAGLLVHGNWIGAKLDGTAAAVTTGVDVVGEALVEGNLIHGGEVGIHVGNRAAEIGRTSVVAANAIDATSGSGILIEGDGNQILANHISGAGAAGIRIHSTTLSAADENEIGDATLEPLVPGNSENVINGSQGAAIEINTKEEAKSNVVLRNSGSGNIGAFIQLTKLNGGEAKAPNNNIQPPVISSATAGEAKGTALPEAAVRVYAKSVTDPGQLGAFLGKVEAEANGSWSLTYTAPAGTVEVAASQTPESELLGSSALALKAFQYSLTVTKAGSGLGTVTSAPAGIECGAGCTGLFDINTVVKLTGAPAGGSKPVAWSGCDAIVGANECQVTLSAAKGVVATFDLIPSDNGGGNDNGGGTSNPPPVTTPPATTPPVTKPAPKALQCKKGFKKKTVKGKTRCVKVPKKKHH